MAYFDNDLSEYKFVPFDIETTGFGAHDTLTTLTLEYNGEYHIWINSDGRDVDIPSSIAEIEDASGEDCTLYVAEDSEEMLLSVGDYIDTHFDTKTVLVAYNGETWNGGFDLQFLRTACLRNNVEWIFNDVKYMDIYPVFDTRGDDRFNTEVPSHDGLKKSEMKEFADWLGVDYEANVNKSELSDQIMDTHYDFHKIHEWVEETDRETVPTNEYSDQVGVYKALTDGVHEYDPWADSGNAVTAFEDGEFVPLVLHNLADVVKTTELTDLVVEYVSSEDPTLKFL